MICARVAGAVVVRRGPPLGPGERLWVCALLDHDLIPSGRALVAVGDSSLEVGALVHLGAAERGRGPLDVVVLGRVDDLGVVAPGGAEQARRVWLRAAPQQRTKRQPQNRH